MLLGLPVQTSMELLLIGFAAGLVHVFTGPDHLAALAPFAVRKENTATWHLGLRWGIGHAVGVAFIGVLIWLLKDSSYVAGISTWAENLVGALLILTGIIGIYTVLSGKIHTHEHNHYGIRHSHIHSHIGLSKITSRNHKHCHAAGGIGLLHGAAGGTHLWVILPTLAIAQFDGVILYLSAYTLSTIVSMILFTTAIGHLNKYLTNWHPRLGHHFGLTCCIITMSIGCYWLLTG